MNSCTIRIAAAILAFLLPLTSVAAVQVPREGLVLDASRAPQRRGVEILHPLKVDRAVFQRALAGHGVWMPATHGSPQLAKFQRTERFHNGDWTWVGRVETEFGEQPAVITFGADAVFGLIPQRHGQPLRIETRSGKTWLVENMPRYFTPIPGDSDGVIAPLPTNEAHAAAVGHAAASQPVIFTPAVAAEVDVLVVYNASMVTAYGSDAAAQTRINQVAALANQAYVDSLAAMHINIVAAKLIDYTAATSNQGALDLLTNASADPVKTQIDAWRTQYGADLVSLVRHFNYAVQLDCGRAWIGGYHGGSFNAGYGFSVVSDGVDSGAGYLCYEQTFAHELGHNMGGQHDTTTSGGDYGAYTDSRGHRAFVSTSGFATVMAYPTGNQSVLSLFSNPALTTQCMGQPCGITDQANNARTLTVAGPSVAAYKAHVNTATLSVSSASVSEGNTGTLVLNFTVSLSQAAPTAVTYNIATANGTATAGSDYVASSLVGESIPAGQLSRTFSVTINGDYLFEGTESFYVNLSAISGATVGNGSGLGTIINDDSGALSNGVPVTGMAGSINSQTFFTFAVPAGATSVTFTTSGGSGDMDLYVKAGTAPTPSAYDCKSDGLTAAENCGPLATTGPVTWHVMLYGYSDYSGVSLTATYAGAALPTLSVSDASTFEGNSGTKTLTFTVSLSGTSPSDVTYTIGTFNGGALAGSDYVASTLAGQTIPAGMLSKTFSVTINGDTTLEPHEAFQARLSAPVGATIADGTGVGMIVNDDVPTIRVGDLTVFEGSSGTKSMVFTVTLSQAATTAVTYTIGTFDGGALAGSDYVASTLAGQSIPAGMLSKTFAVTINGDTTLENNEAYQVRLSAVTGATVLDGIGVGMIVNDDLPTLTINDRTVFEGNSGTGTMVFTVMLSQPAPNAVTYTIGTFDGGALAGSDYVARALANETIPAGMQSRTFSVTTNGDTAVEGNEAYQVRVSAVTGATVLDGTGVGMIVNDD
jgi:hypothetical protein